MGKMNVNGMAEVETNWLKRKEALRALMSKPFELENKETLALIEKYAAELEYSLSLNYIYQAMTEQLKFAATGYFAGLIVTLPGFINYTTSLFVYLGITGWVLEHYSMSQFRDELNDMKMLYNWCFKNGNDYYSSNIDNSDKLANPTLQHLIKVLAPVTSTEFLMAWPKVAVYQEQTKPTEQTKTGWSKVFALGYGAIATTSFLFTKAEAPGIRELKTAVQTRKFDLDAYKGLIQAVNYLSKNTQYKELLTTPISALTQLLSAAVTYAKPKSS